jgi:hypothetical protein
MDIAAETEFREILNERSSKSPALCQPIEFLASVAAT